MSLYVVRHQHDADHCPARDPAMGAMLLQHLSARNASKYGIQIHGDAVVDGQHTLFLILDSKDAGQVSRFMEPFQNAGPPDVNREL